MALGESANGVVKDVMIAVVVAVVSILGTIAATSAGAVSRTEVQKMVDATEIRLNVQMAEVKVKQDTLALKMEQLLAEQIKSSTKIDLLVK